MSFVIKDRVAELTVTTGTGTVTLLGAVRGYQSFSAIGNTNTTCYLIIAGDGVNWEVGIGTYTSAGTTLSRTTILASSNAGSAISLTGTSLVVCTNPANQFGVGGLVDKLIGNAQGTLLYRDSDANGGWLALAPGTSGQFLKTQGAAANPIWSAVGAGGGSGLFGPDISAVPTLVSTGLDTWVQQGAAAMSNTTEGVFLDIDSGHASQIVGKRQSAAVPATPYSITALIGFTIMSTTSNPFACFGWTDGTKFHVIEIVFVSAADWQLAVNKWNAYNSFNGADFSGASGTCDKLMWLGIRDDGTTVYFKVGTSPKSLITVFSVSRASGFLGSTGYSSIFVGGNNSGNGKEAGVELLSWTQGT